MSEKQCDHDYRIVGKTKTKFGLLVDYLCKKCGHTKTELKD